ncbi:hypothetical protein ACHAPU_008595 [Fusarium lateritium]
MSVCQACQDIGEDPYPSVFFTAHGHKQHWSLGVESEEARWCHAEATCEQEYRDALEKGWLTILMDTTEGRSSMTPEVRQINDENLRKVLEHRLSREESNGRARGPYMDDGTESCFVTKPLTLQNSALEISVPIRVVEKSFVREGRWYLGHPPGTFIFQYYNVQACTGDGYQTFMGSQGIISEMDLVYMGQVPRHPNLHAARVRQMWKYMLTLFISELQLRAGPKHLELYPDLEAILAEPHVQSADVFQSVWEHWERRGSEPGTALMGFPNAMTQKNFSRVKHVQEFAWHMCTLRREAPDSDRDAPEHAVWLLLASSTGLPAERLAALWDSQLQGIAEEKLRSGMRDNLFIYEVEPGTEDIHQFYRQPPFDDDPINPRTKYTWPVYEEVPAFGSLSSRIEPEN